MIIGLLKLHLYIHYNRSLKGKRMVIKSLKDRLRNQFNIAVAEVDHRDKWQLCTIAATTVGADKKYVNSLISKVVEFVKGYRLVELLDYELEMI